jgi:putative oxidoreductase
MNSKILLAVRIIFAVFLLFFGANKLFHFVDPPPPPADAMGYWTALMVTKTMTLVAIVEIAAGLSLLLNKYAGLMMVILMSVSVNAVLYHVALDSANVMMALVLLVLNLVMLYSYKDKYKGLLS